MDVLDKTSQEMLETLIADHQLSVWRYLRALGCPPEEADDLTQETFLTVFRRPFKYLGRAAAASYLRRTAYHRFVAFRREKRIPTEPCDVNYVDEMWDRWQMADHGDELLEILAECLADLSERSQYSLLLRFRDGLSRREIAEKLSISEHGARNLMQRAKSQLRDAMQRRLASN